MKATTSGPANSGRRTNTTLAAFMVGLPLAAGVLVGFRFGAERLDALQELGHYVSNPVECVEVVLFCCADQRPGRQGAPQPHRAPGLPRRRAAAVGRPARPRRRGAQAARRRAEAARGFLLNTYLGQRAAAVLEFLYQRGAAADLDDQLRTLADNDVVSMEGGFALTRFITWAIPILGFLGTVLGITTAIHGATPEVLEKSLSTVTDGLSYAFDATALALALTMITMFLSFLVERDEQGVLDAVDRTIDRCLAHRFQRIGARRRAVRAGRAAEHAGDDRVDGPAGAEAGRGVGANGGRDGPPLGRGPRRAARAVRRRRGVGAGTDAGNPRQAPGGPGRQDHASRRPSWCSRWPPLAAAVRDTGREQQAALVRVAEGVAAQAAVLGRLQEGETNLVHLQAVLHQNLAALASASSFEQAVHSLTAAAHLLTARTAAQSGGPAAAGPAAGEGRMRTRRHKLQVSTFPFLAVLLCAMGALLLVLLVMDRRAPRRRPLPREQAVRRAVEEAGREAEARHSAFERQRQ